MKKKQLLGILMCLMMLVSTISIPKIAYAKDKGYLVLIQTSKNGKWQAYEDLVSKSPKGNLMLQAYKTSKALGLTYKNSDKTFTITKGKKKLTYTKNSTSYKYYNGSKTVNKTATYKTYNSKDFEISANVIHYSTLGNVVYTKYYTGSKTVDFKAYKGVILLSTIGNVTTIPKPDEVTETPEPTKEPTKTPEPTKKPEVTKKPEPTKKPDPTPTEKPVKDDNEGYDGSTNIGGVNIPKLPGFSDAYDDSTGHWGNDVKGDTKLEDAIKEYSAQMKKDIIALNDESNGGSTAKVSVSDNTILVEANGDSTLSAIRLNKTSNGYEIYLSTALVYTDYDKKMGNADYTKISNNALRLLCAVISSESETLYKAIFSEWEGNNDYGINKTSYVTVGDCQVKYVSSNGNGYGIYQIKAK